MINYGCTDTYFKIRNNCFKIVGIDKSFAFRLHHSGEGIDVPFRNPDSKIAVITTRLRGFFDTFVFGRILGETHGRKAKARFSDQ